MTSKKVLENLDLVISDCNLGADYVRSGEQNPWDAHSWEAMAYILEEVKEHVQDLECQITDLVGPAASFEKDENQLEFNFEG